MIQEVLQGLRHEPAYRLARAAMLALPRVEAPLGVDLVEQAVELYRAAHRQGTTFRSSVDFLIAACPDRVDLSRAGAGPS